MNIRNYLFILFYFFISNPAIHAQVTDDYEHFIYGSGEVFMGNYFGLGASINYVFKEKYSAQAGFLGAVARPESQPSSYKAGFFKTGPYDHLRDLHLLIGKVFNLKEGKRINIQAGAGYSNMLLPGNWIKTSGGGFSKSHEYTYFSSREYSFICKAKIEAPADYNTGLSYSANYIVNKNTHYLGISIGFLIGIVGKEVY